MMCDHLFNRNAMRNAFKRGLKTLLNLKFLLNITRKISRENAVVFKRKILAGIILCSNNMFLFYGRYTQVNLCIPSTSKITSADEVEFKTVIKNAQFLKKRIFNSIYARVFSVYCLLDSFTHAICTN